MNPTVSVIAPAYNEQEVIEEFVTETCVRLNELQSPYELIVVDDGSNDGMVTRLERLMEQFPELRVIRLHQNQGQSAALSAGIAAATGQYVALMDADLQNDPADIARMLRMLRSTPGCEGIMGVRRRRRDSWLRKLSSRIANWVGAKITKDHVRDAGCGIKLFRAAVIKRVRFFRGAHRFLATLAKLEGAPVIELEVNHRPRPRGQSKYGNGLGRTFVALRDALGVRWLIDRNIRGGGLPATESDRPSPAVRPAAYGQHR